MDEDVFAGPPTASVDFAVTVFGTDLSTGILLPNGVNLGAGLALSFRVLILSVSPQSFYISGDMSCPSFSRCDVCACVCLTLIQ